MSEEEQEACPIWRGMSRRQEDEKNSLRGAEGRSSPHRSVPVVERWQEGGTRPIGVLCF